VIALVVFI